MLARLFEAVADRYLGGDFVIRAGPQRPVSVRGRLPHAKVHGIVEFFAHDCRPPGRSTIRGWLGDGPMRLKFSGPISAGDRQRVRNFLLDHLG